MMYVRLRSALSICDTWPAFLVMKSSYMASQCGGSASIAATGDGAGACFCAAAMVVVMMLSLN